MLQAELDDLINDVRVTLDENAPQSTYSEENPDNLELDELIAAKLPEAARDVTEKCEVELLEPIKMITSYMATEYGGTLTIPDDFLRIVSVNMKGWNRTVTTIAGEGSDIDLMQRNKYTRGTSTKPVCVYGHDANGDMVIEFFGKATGMGQVLYMPVPKVETVNGKEVMKISTLLKQAIVRRAAGLVLMSRGDMQTASQFLD